MSPSSDPSSSRAPRNSPWSHVVRGESEAVPAAPSSPPSAASIASPEPSDRSPPRPVEDIAGPSESPDHGTNGNAAAAGGKKSAWSRPPNGSIEVGPVMGAVSWPALSESTRAAPKLSSSDSIKTGSDGLVSAPPGPVIESPQPKPNTNSPNPNSARQKPSKRGTVSSSSSGVSPVNGGPVLTPPPPTLVEMPQIVPEKPAGLEQPSPKDLPNKNNTNWDHGSTSRAGGFLPNSHGGPDHHRPFNRRGNNGGGGGPHNGGRRDPERGGYEWNNPPRHMPPPPPPHQLRGHYLRPQFIMPPPPPPPAAVAASFIGPPTPVRPFMGPMGFPEIPSQVYYVPAPPPPESMRGLPLVAHPVAHAMPPAIVLSAVDYQRDMLVKQIEYYFSSDNLCKDLFLRQQMDDQGWVPISVIAGFNRVREKTNNIKYILESVQTSEIVEVQDEKIRKRGDWMKWTLPPQPSQYGTASGPQSPATSNYDTLVDRMQSFGLEEGASNHNRARGRTRPEVVLGRSASGNFINQSQVRDQNGERNGQFGGHSHSDP